MNLLLPSASDGGEFHAPSVAEFFPEAFLFEGTPFEINRIMMIRLIVMVLVVVLFWLGTRRMRVIPGRFQSAIEMIIDLPRKSVAQDLLGEKDGKRFAPLIVTIFITVLFMNLTGIIPFANIAGTSVIGLPLVLAVAAYIAFIWAGIRKHGGGFFKTALFPSGVP
ncbi:MAG: F0F1 ATP synthase subunit A, partial [Mycetocola sp.]